MNRIKFTKSQKSGTVLPCKWASNDTRTVKKNLPFLVLLLGLTFGALQLQAQIGGMHSNAVGGGVPPIPGPISGPTSVRQGTVSNYSIASVSTATSYKWSLNPSSAGTVTGSGTSASVTWSSAFIGSV